MPFEQCDGSDRERVGLVQLGLLRARSQLIATSPRASAVLSPFAVRSRIASEARSNVSACSKRPELLLDAAEREQEIGHTSGVTVQQPRLLRAAFEG